MPFYFILQLGFAGRILKEKTIKYQGTICVVNQRQGGNWELYPWWLTLVFCCFVFKNRKRKALMPRLHCNECREKWDRNREKQWRNIPLASLSNFCQFFSRSWHYSAFLTIHGTDMNCFNHSCLSSEQGNAEYVTRTWREWTRMR